MSCVRIPVVKCTGSGGCTSIPDKQVCQEVPQKEAVPKKRVVCKKETVPVCGKYFESADQKVEDLKLPQVLCGQAVTAVLLPDVCTTDFYPYCPHGAPAEVCEYVKKKKCRCAEST